MCLSTVSVDWQGNLYDCDFNQMLEMAMPLISEAIPSTSENDLPDKLIASDSSLIVSDSPSDNLRHLKDLLHSDFSGQFIAIGDHCYGCTAGQGSSCGGALE